MSPAGRPTLSGSVKAKFLQIRVTEEEKASLDAAATACGKGTATWLRELGLTAAAEIAAAASKKPGKKK